MDKVVAEALSFAAPVLQGLPAEATQRWVLLCLAPRLATGLVIVSSGEEGAIAAVVKRETGDSIPRPFLEAGGQFVCAELDKLGKDHGTDLLARVDSGEGLFVAVVDLTVKHAALRFEPRQPEELDDDRLMNMALTSKN